VFSGALVHANTNSGKAITISFAMLMSILI
jgi:hypothetical protein